MNILVGVSGGIACYKAASLVSMLKKDGHDVRVVMTPAAAELISPRAFQAVSANPVALSLFDTDAPHEVKHVSWAKWADLAVLAPATANTLAKLARGLADNMLTTIFLALTCPVIVAPAMNTNMLLNPATQENLRILRERGVRIMEPGSGRLACGDSGPGRMPEPEQIRSLIRDLFAGPLCGKKILITAGPTQEPLDPVRALTNRSSGKMGYALARRAREQGARVTLVSGPVALADPEGCETVRVRTAGQMYDAVMERACGFDVVICAAAVSDYRPAEVSARKIKKSEEEIVLRLVRTRDILRALGENKSYYLVGFAAETEDVLSNARGKLERKNLDMIVANDVSKPGVGFEADDNEATILTRDGGEIQVSARPKDAVADEILARIAERLETE